MKKGILIVIVFVGMISSCTMKTCPTYMYNPDQQKDIRVQLDKTTDHTNAIDKAS